MRNVIIKHKFFILLILITLTYISYFSYYTVLRYKTLYASYFDLGIMNQTVFNTYKAITTGDFSRFLELTNPQGVDQIKRMAIHNDILLALISSLYILYASPITLLLLQSIVLGLGAIVVYKIAQKIFESRRYKNLISIIFAFAYLFYPPLEKANMFDFHAVTLATTFLLLMFYFWLTKKYFWSFVFFILSILSKEQVALTTAFFGIFIIISDRKKYRFGLTIFLVSIAWFLLSMIVIIPYFRGGSDHFALKYYQQQNLFIDLFDIDSVRYLTDVLGSVGFLSLLSPIHLMIALPEFLINLISNSANMRNIYFHYTAVLTPFIFIAAIYGVKNLLKLKAINLKLISLYLVLFTLIFAYYKGPLPFAREQEIHPYKYPQQGYQEVQFWANILKDEHLKVSTVGHLAPFFSSRRYFYNFSENYQLADYIVIRPTEVYNYPEKDELIPVYEELQQDSRFELIYNKNEVLVYKKIL